MTNESSNITADQIAPFLRNLEYKLNTLEIEVESLRRAHNSTKATFLGLFIVFIIHVITSR